MTADLSEFVEDTGDPAAFRASAQRGKAKLAALQPRATPVELIPDERAEIARVLQSQFPRFAARIAAAASPTTAWSVRVLEGGSEVAGRN